MAEARQRVAWSQTAEIAAAVYNNNPYRSRDVSPDLFNPFAGDRPQHAPRYPQISDESAMRIFESCWGLKREPKQEA